MDAARQNALPLVPTAPHDTFTLGDGWRRHPFRVAGRTCAFVFLMLVALVDYLARIRLAGHTGSARRRAEWHELWSRRYLRALGVEVTVIGRPPARGVLVSNHLGYIDVLVLGSILPLVMVAKQEVRSWPLIGWLCRCAGVIFLIRERRRDLLRVIAAFPPAVAQGAVVGFYPEGTSTNGTVVLPFKSSLFAPPVRSQWPVTAAHVSFTIDDGRVEDEVCWWGEMPFLAHYLNFVSKRRIRARVVFGPPMDPGPDRKVLARRMREAVLALAPAANNP